MNQQQPETVGGILIEALLARGVRHVFGVPGDSTLDWLQQLEEQEAAERARGGTRFLDFVNFSDEQGAGFAADAYARVHGLGVLCVTWGVGALKVANPVGGAYAESSPLVVISGAPRTTARQTDALLHHKIRSFETQLRVFEQLTEMAVVLDDPSLAAEQFAALLATAQNSSRPVYLEVPVDLFKASATIRSAGSADAAAAPESDPGALAEAVEQALALVVSPDTVAPVILAGVEVHRLGLQQELAQLVDSTHLPIAANMLGKSVMDERHPCYIGTYWGRLSRDDVRVRVEESDCVLQLGVLWTDFERGFAPPPLRPEQSIQANRDRVKIGHATYENVHLRDFLGEFIRRFPWSRPLPEAAPAPTWTAERAQPVTVARLYEALDAFLSDETVVVSDVGDCLFAARDLRTHQQTEFVSPAYYLSMGFGVPASVGVQLARRAAGREGRPLVLTGDGGFQMTGIELATALRFDCNPIVILLDNDGYTTERYLIDGAFNDILRWDYPALAGVLRDERSGRQGRGVRVETEGDLADALRDAAAYREGFFLIDVRLDRMDGSDALRKLWAS